MRKLLIFSLLLLCSHSLFGADVPGDRWRISVLASEISTAGSDSFAGNYSWNDDAHAGVGLGVAYVLAPQWDVEFTIASQTHRSPYTRFLLTPMPNGQPAMLAPVTESREYRVNPIDLSVTRHFLADQPIAPYVRAGVRYVSAPDDPAPAATVIPPTSAFPFEPVREGFGFNGRERLSAQAGAGVLVRLTPRTALRAEAARLLRSEEEGFDPLMRYAVGLTWVF